jgi:hypothetical protein
MNSILGLSRAALAGLLVSAGLASASGAQAQLTVTAVPEPGSYALMGAGLAMLAALAKRRRNSEA